MILLSLAFLFFVFIDLNFLIPAIIAQSYNPTAELVMPTVISTKEAKAIVETNPVTTEAKLTI